MWLCGSSILITSCLLVGFSSSQIALSSQKVPDAVKLAQATATPANSPNDSQNQTNGTNADSNQRILRPGNSGTEVKALQTKLKQLGLYTEDIDGDYGVSTRIAVSRFQTENNLTADGILGATTRAKLDAAVLQKTQPTSTPSPTTKEKASSEDEGRGIFWWGLMGLGLIGTLGAIAYTLRHLSKPKSDVARFKVINSELTQTQQIAKTEPSEPFIIAQLPAQTQAGIIDQNETLVESVVDTNLNGSQNGVYDLNKNSSELITTETTSRLAKVNIVDELVKDLRSPDPNKRRKAIWDLGQQGDSRAIQPLVDTMIDADSQQRSLILAALSEIGTRTLKPMNRALAMSLQDESPEVRQNAIRDLTRVYDMMTQLSQMLYHATHDNDANVQATAKYALSQMNRIRSLAPDTSPEE
ncbi:peptidoglycan binding domain-containing protein [Calothrix sp. NIES-4071]|nr:peptidoglycan binding domain-containing protein [Calothrix sp. NIES-4071]BAZ62090.1 peptidoglycan binding domain-containing protein [Calothrix sp. NIES-4105]